MGRRDPRHISEALQAERFRVAPDSDLAKLQAAWVGIVGDAVATNCQLVGMHKGVVEVLCSSSVWAHELSSMSRSLLIKMNVVVGREWALQLRFRFTE